MSESQLKSHAQCFRKDACTGDGLGSSPYFLPYLFFLPSPLIFALNLRPPLHLELTMKTIEYSYLVRCGPCVFSSKIPPRLSFSCAGQGRALRDHGTVSPCFRRSRCPQRLGWRRAHHHTGGDHVQDPQGANGLNTLLLLHCASLVPVVFSRPG